MKKALQIKKENNKELYTIIDNQEIIINNVKDLEKYTNLKAPYGINKNLFGCIDQNLFGYISEKLAGDISNIYGSIFNDLAGCMSENLKGKITGIEGDCTNVEGDLDECDIIYERRRNGVNIRNLIN